MPQKLKIKPKLDIQLDGTQTRTLRMRVIEKHTNIPDIWRGYILPSVKINILDADDRSTCTLINDPHITTFDQRRYDIHDRPDQLGDRAIFTVYKHTVESEEVQARFTHCGGRIFCICGVAVRAGSSTIVFDRCRTQPNLIPELNYKTTTTAMDPRMRVFKHNSGTKYHIFLQTSTQVRVSAEGGGNLISIEIKSSVEGKFKSVGLCGNNNGDPSDDLQTSQGQTVCPNMADFHICDDEMFRRSWQVIESESIFQGKVPPHDPGEHMEELYCDCVAEPGHHGYEDCDYHKRFEPCDEGFELFNPTNGYSQEVFPWLKTYREPLQQNPAYASAVLLIEKQYYSSWNHIEWSEESAKKFCSSEILSSPAVASCLKELPNQDYNSSIVACTLDLLLTGSTEFASAHLETIKSLCSQELKMNLDLWEPKEADGEEVMGPPLRLTENLCPNECSGNGACVDGKCNCKKDFSSYDCSLNVNAVPLIKGVVSSSVPCDRTNQDCSVVALEGLKFLEGPGLTCHYTKDDGTDRQYFYSSTKDPSSQLTSPAEMFSLWVVQCRIPEQLSTPFNSRTTLNKLHISISNDGNNQSDGAFYGSYDSRCETCLNKTCTKKDKFCIISSHCYGLGEEKPGDSDLACNPQLDGFDWSPASSLTSPTTPPTPTTTEDDSGVICDGDPETITLHRDPKNCRMYFVCVGSEKHHFPCPLGLAFSEELGRCVHPSQVPGCF